MKMERSASKFLSAKELSRALNSWKIYFADLAIDTLPPFLMQEFAERDGQPIQRNQGH